MFFLKQTKTWSSRMILILAVVLVLFALAQAFLDVAGAATFLRLTQAFMDKASSTDVSSGYELYARISIARAALISLNKHVQFLIFVHFANPSPFSVRSPTACL